MSKGVTFFCYILESFHVEKPKLSLLMQVLSAQTNQSSHEPEYLNWMVLRPVLKMENQKRVSPRFLYEHMSQLGVEYSECADCSPLVELVCGSLSNEENKLNHKGKNTSPIPICQGYPRKSRRFGRCLISGILRPSYLIWLIGEIQFSGDPFDIGQDML